MTENLAEFSDRVAEWAKAVANATAVDDRLWTAARTVYTGELYRVVERRTVLVRTYRFGGLWTPVRTRGGAPRTYTTARAARSAATQLRHTYQRYGIEMEVAVQCAPVGQWEVIE